MNKKIVGKSRKHDKLFLFDVKMKIYKMEKIFSSFYLGENRI